MNVVLRLPGFTPGAAVAKNIVGMPAEAGLDMSEYKDFNPRGTRIQAFRELSDDKPQELIARDDSWGGWSAAARA